MSDSEILDEDSLNETENIQEDEYNDIIDNNNNNNNNNSNSSSSSSSSKRRDNNNHSIQQNSLIYFNPNKNNVTSQSIESYNNRLNDYCSENNNEFMICQSVPPLNLFSEENSIIEVSESCKEAFDIDLRAKTITPHSSNIDTIQSKDKLISTYWNNCSEKLQKLQLENNNSSQDNKKLLYPLNENYQYNESIMFGEDVIGRELISKRKVRTQLNFIASNKRKVNQGNVKSCFSKTYGQLYKVKSHLNTGSTQCIAQTQVPMSSSLKMIMRQREYFQSDPVLFSDRHILENKEDYIHESQCNNNNNLNMNNFMIPSPISSATYKQVQFPPKINKPLFPDSHGYFNPLYSVYTTKDKPSKAYHKINQPTGSYWEIHEMYSSREPLNTDKLNNNVQTENCNRNHSGTYYPTSASGVFRMGMLQQTELAKAHKKFCHKYYSTSSSPSTDSVVRTRLHTLCLPSINNNRTIQSHPNNDSNYQTSNYSYTSRNSSKIYIKRLQFTTVYRVEIIWIRPDTDNDEYRLKLAKKLRQNGYAEHIRKCQEKSIARSHHQVNNLKHINSCENGKNLTTDENNCNEENLGKNVLNMNNYSNQNQTEDVENKTTNQNDDKPSDKQNKLYSSHQVSLSSHRSSKNVINSGIKVGTARSSPEMSKEELQRVKAAEKRLAMLNYAKLVREQLRSQSRSNHRRFTANKQKQDKENYVKKPYEWKSLSKSDADLLEMLHRHEEDKKRFEEVQKLLRIKI
ncbi:unnamed protein product [Heterobilharzia americana]|nr:unnamed protein product [Heterobilharzia americana]